MSKSKWIWNYGDFEFFHSQKLHLRRTEGEMVYPPFWHMPEVCHNVRFKKTIKIEKPEKFTVSAHGVGFVSVKYDKYMFDQVISLPSGEHTIVVTVSNLCGLPSIYVIGNTINSDVAWLSDCCDGDWKNVGCNELYNDKNDNPEIFKFNYKKIKPVKISEYSDGILYDYGKETFGKICFRQMTKPVTVYYGESKSETVDLDNCFIYDKFSVEKKESGGRAFRYLYIPGVLDGEIEFDAFYEYLDTEKKSNFFSSNELLNRIWSVATDTFLLNSREFYLDGIKRDRWVWSGDAYQSYFVNRYLFNDSDICRRTITALGGKGKVKQHINSIPDYTFYWLISIYDYYEMTGDFEFVDRIFPRMTEFVEFCFSRLDENGFIVGTGEDWIFIDWADIDKTGAVCALQILFLQAMKSYVDCAAILGVKCENCDNKILELKKKINQFFWSEKLGAYIDSFQSGKENVTRHANIFALLYGYADGNKRKAIIKNVIKNDDVPKITTPYFKFFELHMMCSIGELDFSMDEILFYWGGMINEGATSFWEEYKPGVPAEKQLNMYGARYGKSLCHAWGASPVYLIGRYFLGVRPTDVAYKTFEVTPHLHRFSDIEATMPVNEGIVTIKKQDGRLTVLADVDGGTLVYMGKCYQLKAGEKTVI